MTGLLVSVRCAAEAEAALVGGAALIDVKEPARGALGRADDWTITDVVAVVAGRRPVSAAMGEFLDKADPYRGSGLSFIKWGLAGCGSDKSESAAWRTSLESVAKPLAGKLVAVAYADWRRVRAPLPEDVCAFAGERPVGAFLLDTCHKDGSTLLDWLSFRAIARLRDSCRSAGVRVALAGSLGIAEIEALRPLAPDWFAVRGAVCRGGQREAAVDGDKVRQLVALLAEPIKQTNPAD
jgi:uncharacterized protein (UPF0264 family)